MFENPRRGRQAKNFTTNVPKILDLKSSSEQIFFRKLSLGAPEEIPPKGRGWKLPCAESFVNDIWSVGYWLLRSVTYLGIREILVVT